MTIPRELLYLADELFFTGTAVEITPIRSVDRITVGSGRRGPITERLQKAFFGLFTLGTPDKWGWLDFVDAQKPRVAAASCEVCGRCSDEDHVPEGLGAARGRAETPDTPAVLYIDRHLIHEVTTPQAFTVLRERGLKLRRTDLTLATIDHSSPTRTEQIFGSAPIAIESAALQIRELERNCPEFGVELLGCAASCAGSCTSSARN